jgi:hypothetical protein
VLVWLLASAPRADQRIPSSRSAGAIFRARASLTIVLSLGSRPALSSRLTSVHLGPVKIAQITESFLREAGTLTLAAEIAGEDQRGIHGG